MYFSNKRSQEGGYRYRPETVKCSPRHPSLLYVYYKLTSDYHKEQRLLVQNRSGGCILSLTDPPRQPEIPSLHLQEQYQFRVLPLCPYVAPQMFTYLEHTVAGYLHPQLILVLPYLDDWLIHHLAYHVVLCQ